MTVRVLSAMSGGVDSSVAALLLSQAGHEVVGVMMKLFENEDIGEDITNACCSLADRGDAERAATVIDIPFYVYNYAEAFRRHVMDNFADEYAHGRTPNPCIECNRFLKFGALLERADKLRCSHVATGHYARIERVGERYLLYRGRDATKDQSYALYFLTQAQLARIVFPLGNYTKSEVRDIASANGLENAAKPDSQDICFVPRGDFGDFLDEYTGAAAVHGDYIDTHGNVLGQHRGSRNYTIGQRRGLGISSDTRLYVTAIDAQRNTVTLGTDADLYATRFTVNRVNLIAVDSLDGDTRCDVKIRYASPAKPATVRQTDNDTLEITFDSPQRAITPGQAAVLYDGDCVIGGGTIQLTINS
ncbi:MAG: tRNA 2-thiouridine(34) synthase MnmA [Oscillospiraceae bacterium]|nr:tRNA 2-thiouridine(34) synthase MnmA [Oscillospiraceae bacterium]